MDHHSPLHTRSWDQTNAVIIDEVVDLWLAQGMSAEKIIFGVPLYGRAFTLLDPLQTTPLSPANGAASQGRQTREPGFLSFYEICTFQKEGWTTVKDPSGAMGPYAYGPYNNSIEWVGWDDIDTITKKVQYAMDKKLGGIMVWDLTLDDFNNVCGFGAR